MLVEDLGPALICPAALAYSALLLSPTSRDPDPPSRPLSVLLLLGISLASLDLGLPALRRADSSRISVLVLTTSPGSEIPEVTVICVFCSDVSTCRKTQQVRWG